jgi:hypothetical protein
MCIGQQSAASFADFGGSRKRRTAAMVVCRKILSRIKTRLAAQKRGKSARSACTVGLAHRRFESVARTLFYHSNVRMQNMKEQGKTVSSATCLRVKKTGFGSERDLSVVKIQEFGDLQKIELKRHKK